MDQLQIGISKMTSNILTCLTFAVLVGVHCQTDFKTSLGLRREDSSYVSLQNHSVTYVQEGQSIWLWCNSTDEWDLCTWIFNEKTCTYLVSHQGTEDFTNCKQEVIYVSKKCEIKIQKSVAIQHKGDWTCELRKYPVEPGVSSLAQTILTMVDEATGVVPSVTNLDLNVGDSATVSCHNDDPGLPIAKFSWLRDGKPTPFINNEEPFCDTATGLCKTTTYLQFTANSTSLSGPLECKSTQTDSFGHQFSASGFIQVKVNEVDVPGPSVLSAGQIGGLVVGLLLIVFIIILIILAFCCGWCCFVGRRQRKPILLVADEPSYGQKKAVKFDQKVAVSQEVEDDYDLRPQIPQTRSHFWVNHNNDMNKLNQTTMPLDSIAKKNYFLAEKVDPYDSEEDRPYLFQFEGDRKILTPAVSLSSIASTHLDDIDLNHHLQYLDWISARSSPMSFQSEYDSDDDDSGTSGFSDFPTLKSEVRLQDNSLKDESWV